MHEGHEEKSCKKKTVKNHAFLLSQFHGELRILFHLIFFVRFVPSFVFFVQLLFGFFGRTHLGCIPPRLLSADCRPCLNRDGGRSSSQVKVQAEA